MAFLADWLRELWFILVESGPWLVGGFLVAGVVHVLLPSDLIARLLGGRGFGGVWKAALVGVPLPLCSCSVIPIAAGLRRDGASKGASAAFAISTPESGVDSIAFTWAVLGPVMGIARPFAALTTALSAGALVAATTKDDAPPPARKPHDAPKPCCSSEPAPAESSCCSTTQAAGCCEPIATPAEARGGFAQKATRAVRHGWIDMPRDLAVWLVVGLALSALIAVITPDGWIAENVGTGLGPMLLMLVAGMPVYVCAIASTPVAAALVAKGLSPGAALVFLLAGPATNMATMAWVAKDLGWRALWSYLGAIAICSIAFGLALDALISAGAFGNLTTSFASLTEAHEHGPAWWEQAFAVALAVMLGAALLHNVGGRLKPTPRAAHAH